MKRKQAVRTSKLICYFGFWALVLLLLTQSLSRHPTSAAYGIATAQGDANYEKLSKFSTGNTESTEKIILDWSEGGPVEEIIQLAQKCSTEPRYRSSMASQADEIALHGALITVFSRVTGTKVNTSWEKGTFLRENGRVIINGTQTFSWARHRQLAWAIVQAAKRGFLPHLEHIESLADIASASTQIQIWNTQTESTIHDVLQSLPGYISSEFLANESLKSGDFGFKGDKRVRHEDLMDPSFKENELDMVISTEVFEHIPFPYLAHRRVHEILKVGGVHVFTVPFGAVSTDSVHATLDPTGEINYVGEAIMHGDPVRPEGVPVFTIFGMEMINKLCEIGFDVFAYDLHIPREGILGAGAVVFIARKRD